MILIYVERAELDLIGDGLVDDIFQLVEICGPVRWPFQSHFAIVRTQDPEHAKKRWKAMREWAVNRLEAKGGDV